MAFEIIKLTYLLTYYGLQIYKSTKCNDMMQTSYCPRGPFCAFAHVERKSIRYFTYALNMSSCMVMMVGSECYCSFILSVNECSLSLSHN